MLVLHWPTSVKQVPLDDVDDDGVDKDVVVVTVTSGVSSGSVHDLHDRVLTTNPQNQIC